MIKITNLIFCGLLFSGTIFTNTFAATYKCTAENGDITYSQTPCQKDQTTNKVLKSAQKNVAMEDCKYAGAFAKIVFRRMRSGLSTQQLYDRYGGLHSISPSTLGIINYVFSFKHAYATQSDRVAFLTVTKCNAKTFGEVFCEDFPQEFQNSIYSCDPIEREQALRLQGLLDQSIEDQLQFNEFSSPPAYGTSNSTNRSGNSDGSNRQQYEKLRIEKCKKRYESKIERIDSRLQQGYSATLGESLRDRKRNLRKRMASECS